MAVLPFCSHCLANVLGESVEGDALYAAHAPCNRLADLAHHPTAILFVHGAADTHVPQASAAAFVAALVGFGADASRLQSRVLPSGGWEGHVLSEARGATDEALAFLARCMPLPSDGAAAKPGGGGMAAQSEREREREIATPRLRLRRLTPDDAPRVAACCGEYAVASMCRFVPHPYTVEDARFFISEVAPRPTSMTRAIVRAHDGVLVGCVETDAHPSDLIHALVVNFCRLHVLRLHLADLALDHIDLVSQVDVTSRRLGGGPSFRPAHVHAC